MDWELVLSIIPHGIGIVVSLGVARYVWQRRGTIRGARYFAAYMLAAVQWSLSMILSSASTNPVVQHFWNMVGSIGVSAMPIAWLAFTLEYTGRGKWLTTRTWVLISIGPIVTLLLFGSYTIQLARGLGSSGPSPLIVTMQRINNLYASLLLLASTLFIVLELVRAPKMYRRQYLSLLIGLWAPWIFGVLALWGLNPFPLKSDELIPLGFAVGGLVVAWGIFRYRVLDIIPIALDTVIDSISDGVIVLDTQHRIVNLNPAAQRMTDLSAEQAAGLPIAQALFGWKNLLRCLDPELTQAGTNLGGLALSEAEGPPLCDIEGPVPPAPNVVKGSEARGDEDGRYYELRISPLYGWQKVLSGWLILLRDITERKQVEETLRESEEKFRAMSASAQDAIIMIDNEAAISFWNEAAAQLFGYTSQEALGEDVHALISPERYYEAFRAGFGEFKTTGQGAAVDKTLELAAVKKDGTEFPIDLSLSAVRLQGKWCATAIIRDITGHKRAEEALRQAKEAAEAANQAKSVFLANMSHELRTPLNAILGFSELMTRDPALTAEQQENLDIIGRSGEHLLGLINDVLELSKIEAGRTILQEENFDLHRLLNGLEEMFYLRAMEQGLSLLFDRALDLPQYVRMDQNKLRQVLINLLSNAVKYTPEGGITLRVGSNDAQRPAGSKKEFPTTLLRFEVEDTGVGIAPEELDAVFDAFVQTESGQRSKQGTGLGIPISRQFVRMMGGDLTVSSEPGKGSVFGFDVRAELVDAADVRTARPKRRVVGLEPGQPVYRLLVVEDRDASRKLLVKLLQPLGFQVREAMNGQEALEVWERWDPHLIWMDMRMPVMDGHEATKRIKATTKGQATVIIALTASAFEEERAVILSEGCDDFLRKPFREGEIYDKLVKHLGVRFIYESAEEEKVIEGGLTTASLTAALAVLPVDWVTELYQAAAQADVALVLDLVERIREKNEPLADALAGLVAEFRFDIIVTLTQDVGG